MEQEFDLPTRSPDGTQANKHPMPSRGGRRPRSSSLSPFCGALSTRSPPRAFQRIRSCSPRREGETEAGRGRFTSSNGRVMPEFGFHHGLVVGHLEESARVRLEHDLARLVEVLVPVTDNIPARLFRTSRGIGHKNSAFGAGRRGIGCWRSLTPRARRNMPAERGATPKVFLKGRS